MPVLKNPQHEKFIKGLISGLSATQAAISAGYSANGAAVCANRLLRRYEVSARLNELRNAVDAAFVVAEHQEKEEDAKRTVDAVIATREARLGHYAEIVKKGLTVLGERAADPTMANVPGGQTGLLVRSWITVHITETVKVIGDDGKERFISVPKVKEMPEYRVDTGLLRELREYDKQASVELQQWTEKRETKHSGTLDVSVTDARLKLVGQLSKNSAARTIDVGSHESNGVGSNGADVRLAIMGARKPNGTTG